MAGAPGDQASELWRLSGLGLEFVGVLGGMVVIGWLLDRWLGTSPWLLLTGVFIGLVGGGYRFAREAQLATRRANEEYRRRHGSDPDRG